MRHPDLPDTSPIETADSAVPQHRAGGWEVTDPPPKPKADSSKPPQRAMSVRMSHSDVADEITVAESAVPFHIAAGWSVIEKPATAEPADDSGPAAEKPKGGRPRASAAKKKEQD